MQKIIRTEEQKAKAHQAITEARAILNMPSRSNSAWQRLTEPERKIICTAAKLDLSVAKKQWDMLQPEQQKEIKAAALRASQWAKTLEIN